MKQHETGKILLTREELYARVWSVPLRRLAPEFGISDVALGRMCRRRNIPCPPPGYWAKHRAGRTAPRPPLPPPEGKISRPALFTVSSTRDTTAAAPPSTEVGTKGFSFVHLLESAAEWEQRDRLRRYLEACEQHWRRRSALSPHRHAWLIWARRQLSRMPQGVPPNTSSLAADPALGSEQKVTALSA